MTDFKEITVPNDLAAAKHPEELILKEAAACGYGENASFAIKLALEEAMTNAFRHGNKCDPTKHIIVRYCVTNERIEIEVCDEGEGFCPGEVPDPTQPGFIERPHGRGIMLMRAYLDEVEFGSSGNSVRLVKFNK
ncbi:MAG TPA: ATP-binding protein [Phycisphaerae bacterium]|nr:ATP-binding protein [Phycisphaerae bacterium]